MTLTFMINIMPGTFIGMTREKGMGYHPVLHNSQAVLDYALIY